MNKSKFEILLDKASELILVLFSGRCHIRSSVVSFFVAWIFALSIILTIGVFSQSFILLSQHFIDNFRDKRKYCAETIKAHIETNKKTIAETYIKNHIVEICKPVNNNLNNLDNDKSK